MGIDMKRVRVIDILRQESERTGVPISEILGSRRTPDLSHLRHYVMWRARVETGLSYPQIGKYMGNKDHTTVLHGVKKIEAMPIDKRRYDPPKKEMEFFIQPIEREETRMKAPLVFRPIYKVA